MHVRWLDTPPETIAVQVDLTIVDPPKTSDLYFWALQASFVDDGEIHGAGHLGLQSISGHPGNTAVNWGGYFEGGGELPGSVSSLPSAKNNPHTRDFSWIPGTAYRLRIERGKTGWSGLVTDIERNETTVVRELFCSGSRLGSVVMWSEVFAPCEGPSTAVRWSNPTTVTPEGSHAVASAQLSYQRVEDGGCTNTNVSTIDDGVEQRTATTRVAPHGQVLHLK
ncbi:MAG: hypothetical protein ACI81L_002440 [Verrucomicrobiales bacterium]|jgi:hypothetical protein